MIKLNKKALVLACSLATISLSSCDKFLDIIPVGKVIPTTLEEYRALLNNAYYEDLIDRGMTDFRTPEGTVRDDATDRNSYLDISVWNDISPSQTTQPWGWSEYYSALYYANAVIHATEISGGSQDERNQLVGEAYMLRALIHFDLVNLFGAPYTSDGGKEAAGVPIKLDLDLENTLGRSSVGEVYNAVLSDIAEARRLLSKKSWEDSRYSYRFTTLSPLALEARVRLYMGEWSAARQISEDLLAQKSDLVDLSDASAPLPNYYQSVENITPYERIYSTSTGGAMRATKDFVESYSIEDYRRMRFYTAVEGKEYYSVAKAPGSTAYRCSFRTGEVYLTTAEAAARLGDLSGARKHLLALLKKRYTPDGYAKREQEIASLDQSALVEIILLERARELAFEGHHWFDLRRTTRPRIEKIVGDKTYTLEQGDARYTLRIPEEAIAANPKLLN